MSYTEFRLRLSGLQKAHKWQMQMTREVAYQVYCLNWMFSKHKPPKKDKFWAIDKKKAAITPEIEDEFIRQKEAYLKKVNG